MFLLIIITKKQNITCEAPPLGGSVSMAAIGTWQETIVVRERLLLVCW